MTKSDSPAATPTHSSVHARLANKKLATMRVSSGVAATEKTKQQAIKKLTIAIKHALFLDDQTKQKWLKAADYLDSDAATSLTDSILRENFRWKKGERKLEFSNNL